MTEEELLKNMRKKFEEKKKILEVELSQIKKKLEALDVLEGSSGKTQSQTLYKSAKIESVNGSDTLNKKPKKVFRRKSRKGISEKCLEIINSTDEVLRPKDVLEIMIRNGHLFECENPMNSVAPALKRLAEYGDILRIAGKNNKGSYQRKGVNENSFGLIKFSKVMGS